MASKRAKIGFAYHLTAYLAVNAILIWVNIDASPDYFWAQWPLIGWGIGLAFHGLSILLSSKKSNKGFFYHLAAYVIINALLIFINVTAYPQYSWFKFPLIAWTFMLVFHGWRVFSSFGRKTKLE